MSQNLNEAARDEMLSVLFFLWYVSDSFLRALGFPWKTFFKEVFQKFLKASSVFEAFNFYSIRKTFKGLFDRCN